MLTNLLLIISINLFSIEKVSASSLSQKADDSASDQQQPSSSAPTVSEQAADENTIEQAVDFASQATGVRKDFLMGMLVVESNLGKNTGKCTYQDVESGAEEEHAQGILGDQAWQTFLSRQATIMSLAQSLGYNYENLQVSCNPGSAYVGTGGALGVSQFMPDIWMDYKDRISAIVGKENPDPWNVKDAAVAMALLLSDTPGVTDHNMYSERNAAKMYLSGTTSEQYGWYADQVAYWSKNYAKITS